MGMDEHDGTDGLEEQDAGRFNDIPARIPSLLCNLVGLSIQDIEELHITYAEDSLSVRYRGRRSIT